jgi:hypothetical protein
VCGVSQDWKRTAEIEKRLQREQAAVIAELQAPKPI